MPSIFVGKECCCPPGSSSSSSFSGSEDDCSECVDILCGHGPGGSFECEFPFAMNVSGVTNGSCIEADCDKLNESLVCIHHGCVDTAGGCEDCYTAFGACCWYSFVEGGGGSIDLCFTNIGAIAFGFGFTKRNNKWYFVAWISLQQGCDQGASFQREINLPSCDNLFDFIESQTFSFADICWDHVLPIECDLSGIQITFTKLF